MAICLALDFILAQHLITWTNRNIPIPFWCQEWINVGCGTAELATTINETKIRCQAICRIWICLIRDRCHNNQFLDIFAKHSIHSGCRIQSYSNNYDGFVIGNRSLNLCQYLPWQCKQILAKSCDNLFEIWKIQCNDRTVLDTICRWVHSNDTEMLSGQTVLLRMHDCIGKLKTKKPILEIEQ